MTRFLVAVLLFAAHTLFAEDLLLDDFATGNGINGAVIASGIAVKR